MAETTRVWIVGAALMLAGIAMIIGGALASAAEVAIALPACGSALLAAGLLTVLLKQRWESTPR